MSRYFLTTSAAKPVTVGGYSFSFEPVALRGGTWLGILAVEDDSAAGILASSPPPNVEEIPFSKYEELKKKHTEPAAQRSSQPTPQIDPNPALAIASPAARPTDPTIVKQNSTEMITAVTLLTTRQQPPSEPLLEVRGNAQRPR